MINSVKSPVFSQLIVAVAFLFSLGYAQQEISSQQLLAGIQNGDFDGVLDVRSQREWNQGRIENATFVENLASTGNADSILGCTSCTFAVYCTIGVRAGTAIQRLRDLYGFTGTLYNAGGTSQWEDAGYSLVTSEDSVALPCSSPTIGTCSRSSTSIEGSSLDGGNETTNGSDYTNLSPTIQSEQASNAISWTQFPWRFQILVPLVSFAFCNR